MIHPADLNEWQVRDKPTNLVGRCIWALADRQLSGCEADWRHSGPVGVGDGGNDRKWWKADVAWLRDTCQVVVVAKRRMTRTERTRWLIDRDEQRRLEGGVASWPSQLWFRFALVALTLLATGLLRSR